MSSRRSNRLRDDHDDDDDDDESFTPDLSASDDDDDNGDHDIIVDDDDEKDDNALLVTLPVRLVNSSSELASSVAKPKGRTASQHLVLLGVFHDTPNDKPFMIGKGGVPTVIPFTFLIVGALLPSSVIDRQTRLSPDAFFDLVYSTISSNPHLRDHVFGSLSRIVRTSRGLQTFNGWQAYIDEPSRPEIHGRTFSDIRRATPGGARFRNFFSPDQLRKLLLLIPSHRRRPSTSSPPPRIVGGGSVADDDDVVVVVPKKTAKNGKTAVNQVVPDKKKVSSSKRPRAAAPDDEDPIPIIRQA
jgi:hypothetical protein